MLEAISAVGVMFYIGIVGIEEFRKWLRSQEPLEGGLLVVFWLLYLFLLGMLSLAGGGIALFVVRIVKLIMRG